MLVAKVTKSMHFYKRSTHVRKLELLSTGILYSNYTLYSHLMVEFSVGLPASLILIILKNLLSKCDAKNSQGI